MTPETHAMLLDWLANGTDDQKLHARHRLAIHEGREVEQPAPPPVDSWMAKIRACEDYNPACCHSPAPYCTRYHINPTRERCIECLSVPRDEHPDAPGGADPSSSAAGRPD